MSIDEVAMRVAENLLERPEGPLAFRFAIQPLVAVLSAVRDGIRDARTGKRSYFLLIALPSDQQGVAWREGFRATARIMALAMILDAIYQFLVLGEFYLGEALAIALLCGFVPYALARGPVGRIAGALRNRGSRRKPH